MTERLLNLKTLPALLVLLFCTVCTSAWGAGSCQVTSGEISLPSINTNSSNFIQNDTLGYSYVEVDYTCDVYGGDFRPQLVINDDFINSLSVFKDAGLGVNLKIDADGVSTPISWTQISTSTGNEKVYYFGKALPQNEKFSVPHKAFLTLTVFAYQAYKKNSTRITLTPKPLIIRPDKGINTSSSVIKFWPFNVNIISEKLIKLDLSTNNIDIGYFYTGYKNKPTTKHFTVKISQNEAAAPNQNFTLPLMIQFGDGTNPSPADLTGNGESLLIKNTDNDLNGLQLSLKKGDVPVAFNTPKKMDHDITIGNIPYDSMEVGYDVTVAPVPEQALKTGPFRVEIPVIVTYN